jgi:hypothetical protein
MSDTFGRGNVVGEILSLTYAEQAADFACWGVPVGGWDNDGIATLGTMITVGPEGNVASGVLQDVNSDPIPDGWTFPAFIFVENNEIFDIVAFNAFNIGAAAGFISWGEGGTPQPLIISGGLQGSSLSIFNLPSSDPYVAGQLWSNLGILTVSAG